METPMPALGRIVHYIGNDGRKYAAIISEEPRPDVPHESKLIVFDYQGTGAYPIYAAKGEGRGQWSWPVIVIAPPTKAPPTIGLGTGVGLHSEYAFGYALDVLKHHRKRVTRAGWNGREMFLFYMPGYPEGVPANANTARAMGTEEGALVRVLPYIAMRTVDGSIVPWLASQTDVLATDWMTVE